MFTLTSALSYLTIFSVVTVTVLVALVIYGNVLDNQEDEEIYLNPVEQRIMAGEQPALIERMNGLARVITVLAIVSGITLLASAGLWVYIDLFRS